VESPASDVNENEFYIWFILSGIRGLAWGECPKRESAILLRMGDGREIVLADNYIDTKAVCGWRDLEFRNEGPIFHYEHIPAGHDAAPGLPV